MIDDTEPATAAVGGFGPANVPGNSVSPGLSSLQPAAEFMVPPMLACIAVNPEKVNFGGKKFGEAAIAPLEISACNEVPLLIHDIHIAEGSSPDFDWDASGLEAVPTTEKPLVVPPGSTVNVNVIFIPDAPNPLTEQGNIILDEGTLVITNSSLDKLKEVKLSGASAS